MQAYLQESEIINFSHPEVQACASKLASGCTNDNEVAKKCFEFVRDAIRHTGDCNDDITTYKASDVLEHKTGWCYAKSHLLAALLRANNIPTALCYQRLSINDNGAPYSLHGFNAIYLKAFGWYRVDARGNRDDIDAQFNPPHEALAFTFENRDANEGDLEKRYEVPLDVVVNSLQQNPTIALMRQNFPDAVID